MSCGYFCLVRIFMQEIRKKLQLLQQWFERKKELAQQFFRRDREKFYPRKGEIYLVEMGVNLGHEVDKQRPAIVFQSDRLRSHAKFLVLPLTSKVKSSYNSKLFVHLRSRDLLEGSLKTKSVILVDQMRVVSDIRLIRYIGKVKPEMISKISQSINYFIEWKNSLQYRSSGGDSRGYLNVKF